MTAKEFCLDYMNNHPDNVDPETNKRYFDNLTYMFKEIRNPFYTETICHSRWWENIFCVMEINNRLIGYDWALAHRDESIFDLGFEFNEDSLCFVEPYEVKITKYRKINAN